MIHSPILVIADIHGNLEALEAVLHEASGSFEKLWVLGDIAGYGPDPNLCLELLRKHDAAMIAGNHDFAACGKISSSNFNFEAEKAIQIHRAILSEESKTFLRNLPEIMVRHSATLAHGNPENPIWGYVMDNASATRVLAAAKTPLTLIGHTHIPALWNLNPRMGVQWLKIECDRELSYSDSPHLANPGSVGQSRDNTFTARYMILQPESKTIIFKSCSWDRKTTRKKMLRRGYPRSLVNRMAPE